MSSENTRLPLPLLVLMAFFALLIITGFTFAISRFIAAGKKDAADRRRRMGADAKDPLDPRFKD